MRRLNLIKVVSRQTWGADKSTLLKMYRTLIRSKIDYACIAYSTAKRKILKKLDSVHHTGIRIATGAFKSSPVISILNEAGEESLEERRHKFLLSYAVSLADKPQHSAYSHIFQTSTEQNNLHIKNTTPLQIKINNILNNINFQLPNIHIHTFHTTPPWLHTKLFINDQLSKYKKSDTPPDQYRAMFEDIKHQYGNFKFYYTDASISSNVCRIAAVSEEEVHTYQLLPTPSIYRAEAEAILKCLKLANCNITKNIAVCSDCQSVLTELKNGFSSDTTVQKIQDMVRNITTTQKKEVIFIWTPGHAGILGNEKANNAARGEFPEHAVDIIPITLSSAEVKQEITRKLYNFRLNKWLSTTENKLRQIKDDISNWDDAHNRRDQVILTRLRIGHTRLTHEHLMAKKEPKICILCNEPISVKHILVDCLFYIYAREKYNLPSDMHQILKLDLTEESRLLNFLEEINIIHNI